MTLGWEQVEDELSDADIHVHDKFQFELKSEYTPISDKKNKYLMEFFLFVPSSLQVNRYTYSKSQFYLDQTSLIRFKTPVVPLKELIASNTPRSPLYRIEQLVHSFVEVKPQEVLKELKLFANIARSALRTQVNSLEDRLRRHPNGAANTELEQAICQFCRDARALRLTYQLFQERHQHWWQAEHLREYISYIDEFLSMATERYLATVLDLIHEQSEDKFPYAVADLKEEIIQESAYRQRIAETPPPLPNAEDLAEYLMYRQSLLKKFVWEVLFLTIKRRDPGRTFRELIASGAAALAMSIYLIGLSYYSPSMVLNSTAFIMVAVILYVLKDRIKDAIKQSSAGIASRWLPDYTTNVQTPDGKVSLGALKEFFTFLGPKQIPRDIIHIRNSQFHSTLDQARRIEEVIYYRKEVDLTPSTGSEKQGEPLQLNDIFRLNISQFLTKASDPYKEQLQVDPQTGQLQKIMSPKVYHVNIITRQSYHLQGQQKVVLKKYRLILDKEGIKRLEKIDSYAQASPEPAK